MSYIAIRNTEYKGVYREKGFNKQICKIKGLSHRTFKESELEKALKWAEVKDVTNVEEIKENIDTPSTEHKITSNNPVFEVIMNCKEKGYDGVCLTTKNFGEIYLKLNSVNIFMSPSLIDYCENRDSLVEYFKRLNKECCIDNIKAEILKFEGLSEVNVVNSSYINLGNFWTKPKSSTMFAKKEILISNTIALKMNFEDVLQSYKDFTINNDEVSLIQHISILPPRNKEGLGTYCYISGWCVCEKITMKEAEKIEDILSNTKSKNFVISRFK